MAQRLSGRIEKTVFVSYRRSTGSVWALAISKDLTHHGYDVFFDFQGIASGDFEQVIVQNIKARAHFLVLLTPSALEGIEGERDWLRREIETALESQRNIIPLMLDGFQFSAASIGQRLTGSLAPLKAYNGLTIPVEYFEEAMHRLRTRYLTVPVDAVLHPASEFAQTVASEQQVAVEAAPSVEPTELTAEEWFERGYEATDPDEEISLYTQAIELKPDLAAAYCNRGRAYYAKDDLSRALADFNEFVRLSPADYKARLNRGNTYHDLGDFDRAVADFDESIRLESWNPNAYLGRAQAREKQGQHWTVVADLFHYLDMTEAEDASDRRKHIAEVYASKAANPPGTITKYDVPLGNLLAQKDNT